MNARIGISKQRGFWLRYFLGSALSLAIAFGFVKRSAEAQIVVERPLHLRHIQGYVLTETEKPIAGAEVHLVSDVTQSLDTKTDSAGQFDFPQAKGRYLLRVMMPHAAIAARDVVVGTSFRSALHRGPIYVMINPRSACSDCTSPIFGRKKDLDRAVREIAEQSH